MCVAKYCSILFSKTLNKLVNFCRVNYDCCVRVYQFTTVIRRVIIVKPWPPKILSATSENNEVTLTWKVTFHGNSPITKYRIEFRKSSGKFVTCKLPSYQTRIRHSVFTKLCANIK